MAHMGTCICTECLPGGKREHRVKPYGGADPGDCEHGGALWHRATLRGQVSHAEVRYRVELLGGGSIVVCRLCGTVVERVPRETPCP